MQTTRTVREQYSQTRREHGDTKGKRGAKKTGTGHKRAREQQAWRHKRKESAKRTGTRHKQARENRNNEQKQTGHRKGEWKGRTGESRQQHEKSNIPAIMRGACYTCAAHQLDIFNSIFNIRTNIRTTTPPGEVRQQAKVRGQRG